MKVPQKLYCQVIVSMGRVGDLRRRLEHSSDATVFGAGRGLRTCNLGRAAAPGGLCYLL